MKLSVFFLFILFLSGACYHRIVNNGMTDNSITFRLTDAAKGTLFQEQSVSFGGISDTLPSVIIDDTRTYQEIDGFGCSLTGGSALHIYRMDPAARAALLQELFATGGNNIGMSYLRVSIGASDLDEKVFSYNDLPAGETDPEVKKFDLGYDKLYLIPVLKEILAINPKIKIMGSPWSAPVWMKTNNDSRGGSLKPEYYDAYARYFVKYIQAMKAEGIVIDAITIQNEPLHPGNNPSMFMPDTAQALFIKRSLGPAFKSNNIKTRIIVYDHNADRPDYPLTIYKDAEASQYVDGAAFHLYGGKIEALSGVHNAFPEKNLYFTEQWVGAPGDMVKDISWHVKTLIIGGTRNWCRTILEWNLANNPENKPHTDRGGCDRCLGAVTIDGNLVSRNPAYYTIAHASKYVRPGSVRIESSLVKDLPNTAFKTSGGKIVLIIYNAGEKTKRFNVKSKSKSFSLSLDKESAATLVW